MARDKQKGRVYRAETEGWNRYFNDLFSKDTIEDVPPPILYQNSINGKPSPRRWFKDLDEIREYIEKVLNKAPIKKRYPKAVDQGVPRLKQGRRNEHAYAQGGWRISLPIWAWNEPDVLHELAHIINSREFDHNERSDGGHGWRFCRIHLDLVQFVVGKKAEQAIRYSYRKNRVKFYPKKNVKELSEERKQKLREQIKRVAQGVRLAA